MIVFLIGMPACGKTTMGKRLAKKVKFKFNDLDTYISLKENQTISKLFQQKGELFFRELETKYLKEISDTKTDAVISVGGGTPCFDDNIKFMLSTGTVIYLNTSVETLFARLKENNKRPMFAGLSMEMRKEKISSLLKTRAPFYLQANYTVQTEGRSDDQIVEEIRRKIIE